MKTLNAKELNAWMLNSEKEFQLIDVREQYEFDAENLDGELIPLASIPNAVDQISKTIDVVIYCRSGMRSANAIQYLEQTHGFTNLYNLEGGILAYLNAFK